jgi:hypothetical protein
MPQVLVRGCFGAAVTVREMRDAVPHPHSTSPHISAGRPGPETRPSKAHRICGAAFVMAGVEASVVRPGEDSMLEALPYLVQGLRRAEWPEPPGNRYR